MTQKWRKLGRHRKVTETHHLLAGVGDGRSQNGGLIRARRVLVVPQPADVVVSLEADNLKFLVQTALYRRQTTRARSDHRYLHLTYNDGEGIFAVHVEKWVRCVCVPVCLSGRQLLN